jgi:tRNA uridine 5-carbamoylmethylation protein Kti12
MANEACPTHTMRYLAIKQMLNDILWNPPHITADVIMTYMSDEAFAKLEEEHYEEMKWRGRGCDYW